MKRMAPGNLAVVGGFVPWIAYWTLSGAGRPALAGAVALLAALGLGAWQLARRRPRALELVTLAFFAAQVTATRSGSDLFRTYDGLLANGTLAAMAWGTLLAGSPFTLQYAREAWPRAYWTNPIFRRTNVIITGAWGLAFLLNTGLAALALARPAARLWLVLALPNAVLLGAGAFTVVFQRRYPRRALEARLAAGEPYPWAPPRFAAAPAGARGPDVVVAGAGIGGLTAAALLARRGLRVLVAEQHYLPGGFCTSWPRLVRVGSRRLRYVFDAGVHDVSGLGPRGPVRHLLAELELAARLEWRRVHHRYVLPDLRLTVPERAEEFVGLLADRFPAERERLHAFFAEMEGVYRELYAEAAGGGGMPAVPGSVEAALAWPAEHPHALRWMDAPFQAMLDAYLRDPHLKAVMSVLTAYLTDTPAALTVGAMAPIFGYYFDGGYYPVGGSQAFADALVAVIRDPGGEVRLRTPVRRIVVEGGRATGVELADGRRCAAEAVVSNADARRTFLELVGREHLPPEFSRRVEGLRPSASAFVVFLGVDYVPDAAPLTMVAGPERRIAIAIPSLLDPALAPPGHASVALETLVSPAEAATWDRSAPGYRARKRRFGDALLAVAEEALPGLGGHVVYRQEGSPATFARYAWTTGGAIYGPAAGPWRPPLKSPVEGLVLAGAGVFPGAGVEAVVISGTLAADALYPATRARGAGTGAWPTAA